jgi:hypothetical protein
VTDRSARVTVETPAGRSAPSEGRPAPVHRDAVGSRGERAPCSLSQVVAPTVARSGRRLFDDDGDLARLDLLDVARTPSGAVLLGYRVAPAG